MSKKERMLPLSAVSVATVVAIWWTVAEMGLVRPIFLASPAVTAVALWELMADGRFVKGLFASTSRIVLATALSIVVGAVVGAFMGVSRRVEAILRPVVEPLRYLPITALLPLFILWFGIGETARIAFLFAGTVCYFIPLVRNAIRTVPSDYLEAARAFGASRAFILRRVFWPHALPQIFDGLIVINGIGWTYVILAEIVNAREGLGYLIHIAGRLQRSEEVFAGLILIAVVAIASDRLLHTIREKYLFW